MIDALLRLEIWLFRGRTHRTDERGAALVEYALLVALIAIVCLLAILFLGNETKSSFTETGSSINAN